MMASEDQKNHHYKMCKKIAQLTKVIYHLNTQNEDYVSEGDEVSKRSEEEVKRILSDNERILDEYKRNMEEKQNQV